MCRILICLELCRTCYLVARVVLGYQACLCISLKVGVLTLKVGPCNGPCILKSIFLHVSALVRFAQ